MHLEADAEMQRYEVESEHADSDKVSKRSLNLVQREHAPVIFVSDDLTDECVGNLEVLGRPKSAQATSEAAEPQAAAA